MASNFTYTLMPKNTILRNDGKFVPVTFWNQDFQLFVQDCISVGLYKDGEITEDNVFLPEPDEQLIFGTLKKTLNEQKTKAKQDIDQVAALVRSEFVTISIGQELTYYDKADEAMDYIADGCPEELNDYPYIRAESEAIKTSAKIAAERILTARSNWIAKNSSIEQIRIAGKKTIDTAKNGQSIDQTRQQTIEALIQLQK